MADSRAGLGKVKDEPVNKQLIPEGRDVLPQNDQDTPKGTGVSLRGSYWSNLG